MALRANSAHGKVSELKRQPPSSNLADMNFRCGLLAVLLLIGVAGCQKQAPATPPAPGVSTNLADYPPGWPPTKAQDKLPVIPLFLSGKMVEAEVAMKPMELMTGMMFRKKMGENEGMLFVLPYPQRASFYMKNTPLPLQIAYVDVQGTILELHELKPFDEKPAPSAEENIQFVLEMNTGWFTRNQLSTGTVIRTQAGGLKDAFRFGK